MKKFCLICMALSGLLSHVYGQKKYQLVQDSLSPMLQLVEYTIPTTSARIADYDIQITVKKNTSKPESAVDVHMVFASTVDIESVFTVELDVKPACTAPCNMPFVSSSFLSSKAINKQAGTIDFTIGSLLPGKSYSLRSLVFGLDGAPCSGSEISTVPFQTEAASASVPAKMLLVINDEWKNSEALQTAFAQYETDVKKSDPLITIEKYYISNANTEKLALYEYIRRQYQDNNLTHLFFIGANAAITGYNYRLDQQGKIAATHASHTFTYYTLPLYSTYNYDPADDSFKAYRYQDLCFRPSQEVRLPVFQQQNSTISMGMIIPDKGFSTDKKTNYILDYFTKLHKFRNKEISFKKNVLVSDGFATEQGVINLAQADGAWKTATALKVSHPKDPDFSGNDPVWKDDFLTKLETESYEIFTCNVHGSANYHSFGIYNKDVDNLGKLNTQLINLSSCNVGAYTGSNYLAGQYLAKGNVLNVHAYSDLLISITATGESALEQQFKSEGVFTLMKKGFNVSDAFRFAQSYNESDVILGDPLVTFQREIISTPLPVSLQNFTVQKQENVAKLVWTTTSETNSDRFEIERSNDTKNWNKIAVILAGKNSSGVSRYSYTDDQTFMGQNLYRLKMIDQDETFSYSQIRNLSFDSNGITYLYPNPVSDKFYISANETAKVKSIQIINALGQDILYKSEVSMDGISVDNLIPGSYTVLLKGHNGIVKSKKIMVAR